MTISDWVGILTLAFTVCLALIGGAKWLLSSYHEKEEELAKMKSEYRTNELRLMDEKIAELKKVTSDHALKIQTATLALEKSYLRYNAQAESIKTLSDNLKEATNEMRVEMKGMRTSVQQLTHDLILIKTRASKS